MSGIQDVIKIEYSSIWKLSLFSFIVAGFTGFIYRFGLLAPLPEWLMIGNIRHAHSHLMFFNWITPPVFIWMAAAVVSRDKRLAIRKFKFCLYTMMAVGFLSWPFFLLYGYRPVAMGTSALPVAAMLSGLVMLTWYWFAWLYYGHRKKQQNTITLLLFDAALVALVVSSLGAWGVSVYQFSSLDSPLISKALTSFFLGVFTEGWAVLGIFGMIWSKIEPVKNIYSFPSWLLWKPILVGSILVFPFSLPEALVPPVLMIAGSIGALLIVSSTAVNFFCFLKNRKLRGFFWNIVLVLLSVKILMMFASVLPIDIWPGEHGLRILYLHLLLLGIVSPVILDLYYPDSFSVSKLIFIVSTILVIVSLVMISGYWPDAIMPGSPFYIVTVLAFFPLIPVCWMWGRLLIKAR